MSNENENIWGHLRQAPKSMEQLPLETFLKEIDERQKSAYGKIPLFDKAQTDTWTEKQKPWFVKVFYHTRGHFDRLLWTRLMNSKTEEDKQKILTYMAEEAGLEDGKSYLPHEQLFERFAKSMGVALTPEVTEREGFLPFVHDFNFNLISYFKTDDQSMGEILFMAYERLDNLDYESMYNVARALGVSGDALEFFEVHKDAKHFDKTSGNIQKLWNEDPEKVKRGFETIYANQLKMWQGLSDSVFNFQG